MKPYAEWLQVALAAAEEAGDYIRQAWGQVHTIHQKGYRDIVTQTDITVESMILKRLRSAFPSHAVTSEEAGADAEEASVRWWVDPVDGTTNFSRNNPNFSTAIAAVEDGVPVVGVVFDALRGLAFAASVGGGATLNGEPMHVSGVTSLTSAVFGIDTPREPDLRQKMWSYVGKFLSQGRTLRALGSAALNMAYVASGWTDGYFSVHMKPWDQTASALLVMEAGGAVSTLSGEPWTPQSPDPLMASSEELLAEVRAVLRGDDDATP